MHLVGYHVTPFMLRPQTLAEVMAAVIPCSRLYGWIGRQLVAKATLEGNPYKGGAR